MTCSSIDYIGATAIGNECRFLHSALIGPNNGRSEWCVVRVDGHNAHHLTTKSDRYDVGWVDVGLSDEGACRQANGPPPLDWILLGPTGLRVRHGIGGQ